MEHLGEEQYSEYLVERNPRAYMSMREYRNQWMGTPSYSVTLTYAPPPHPQYSSWSQPQPPQQISPIEQAILDLTKLVGGAVVEQKEFNAQLSQKIHTVENSVDQKLDGFQSEVGQQVESLQCSISKLARQLVHQGEENPEDECLIEAILGEQAQLQPQEELKVESVEAPPEELQDAAQLGIVYGPWKKEEEILPLLSEESNGHETGEEPQEPILQPIPMKLNPSATAQPQNNPLLVYILPPPATKSKPTKPAPKTHASPSLPVQYFKKLVAFVQTFSITSKKMAAAHTAWHSGWFGCRFGFGAPEPWPF